MAPITLLVISDPTSSHSRLLEQLPEPVNILVGDDLEFLRPDATNDEDCSCLRGYELQSNVKSDNRGCDKLWIPEK
ncbi:MAG TPA: hypothetical protein VEU96_14680 [Bryobacteraceae bacterium]|nr:hypothetical protein [Bryobacteraceae bacterium]